MATFEYSWHTPGVAIGVPMAHLWRTRGVAIGVTMAYLCRTFVVPMAYPWRIHGVPLAYPWRTFKEGNCDDQFGQRPNAMLRRTELLLNRFDYKEAESMFKIKVQIKYFNPYIARGGGGGQMSAFSKYLSNT